MDVALVVDGAVVAISTGEATGGGTGGAAIAAALLDNAWLITEEFSTATRYLIAYAVA